MKRILAVCALAVMAVVLERPARSAEAPGDSLGAAVESTLTFTVEAGNRLYLDWKEEHTVALRDTFYLGDSEFTAVVESFLPDFRIVDGKPVSLADTLGNPAVHVFVLADSGAVDSSWAFLNFPPHFSARSFYTFQLKQIIGFRPKEPAAKEH
jgi:hypothetical protein